MRKAPPILVESMLFPYLRGLVFCSRLVNSGGWKAIDDAYADPPLSTEQILHPEKYRKDFPTAVELGELGLPKPWSEVGRNVVGEMQLAVLLRSHGGKPAAAGWDGDRFAVFENPEGRIGLVWFSTWDSPDEAKEFAKAYVRFQTTKLGKDAVNPEAFPDAIRRPSNGRLYASERRGSDVVVVEGFEADETDRLIEAAFRSKKTEIRKAEFPKPKEASAAKSEKK